MASDPVIWRCGYGMKTRAKLIALSAGILLASGAHAQSYPTKAILIVLPQQAGSASDVMVRIVSQKMSENAQSHRRAVECGNE